MSRLAALVVAGLVTGLGAGAGSLALVGTPPAGAAGSLTFTVTSTADTHDAVPGNGVCADATGQCTVRAAVEEAGALPAGTAVTVVVPAGTYKLALGTLAVTANAVSLDGAGPTATILKGTGHASVVHVAAKAQAALNQLEITRGGGKSGGGLDNAGTTTLSGVTVTANKAASGAGIANSAKGSLTLVSSAVSSNSVTAVGLSKPGGPGGGIDNAGALALAGTTVSANYAGYGGLGLNDTAGKGGSGGGIYNTGTVSMATSTVSGNVAGSGGLGNQEVGGSGGSGGGIYSADGPVTIQSSQITHNTAGYAGANETGDGTGTAGNGGGVFSSASLTVTGSTFTSNGGGWGKTSTNGGGLYTSGRANVSSSVFTGNQAGAGSIGTGGNGGAIANSGSLTLSGSTLSGNAAGTGGSGVNGLMGGCGGGLFTGGGSATLTGDTFSANSSGAGGGAPYVDPGFAYGGPGGDGGGIYAAAALSVSDSTLSGNVAALGGKDSPPLTDSGPPGVGGGIAVGAAATTLSYVTVAGNSDGIDNLGGAVTLGGTIVADSTGANCQGPITETSGYNLDSGATCAFSAASDQSGHEPLLGALGANGGPTATQALLAGSPAIDHGGTSSTGCPTTDQRGSARPDEAADAGACDIGAYESQGLG